MRLMTWRALSMRPCRLLHSRHLLAGRVREGERDHRQKVSHHARQTRVESGAACQASVRVWILVVVAQVEIGGSKVCKRFITNYLQSLEPSAFKPGSTWVQPAPPYLVRAILTPAPAAAPAPAPGVGRRRHLHACRQPHHPRQELLELRHGLPRRRGAAPPQSSDSPAPARRCAAPPPPPPARAAPAAFSAPVRVPGCP